MSRISKSNFPGRTILIVGLIFVVLGATRRVPWGFYPHQLINKLAIYTLPYEMLPFYKSHDAYISSHAVDPDKRRYSSPYEAIRHYMDLDFWYNHKKNVPVNWSAYIRAQVRLEAICADDTLRYSNLAQIANAEDSTILFNRIDSLVGRYYWNLSDEIKVGAIQGVKTAYSPCSWVILMPSIEHGILPYHIFRMYQILRKSFERHQWDKVLRYSADLGHYVADAHVPLHTTSNYDGQQTGQEGIHAFWETRIPELLAASDFDLFSGKAKYIENVQTWALDIILSSHALLQKVLAVEDSLSKAMPYMEQYEYVERNGQIVKTQSAKFAKSYETAMGGMVEKQMRAAINSIGSLWLTAWVDAGQPDLPQDWRPNMRVVQKLPDSTRYQLEQGILLPSVSPEKR